MAPVSSVWRGERLGRGQIEEGKGGVRGEGGRWEGEGEGGEGEEGVGGERRGRWEKE